MEVLEGMSVEISAREVLRLQGYRNAQPSPQVLEIVNSQIEEGYRLIEPRAVCTEVGVVEIEKGTMKLSPGRALSIGSFLSAWCEGSEYLTVAVCTIGPVLEARVAQLFALGEYASAMMLDSVGSVAVESAADQVNWLICEKARSLSLSASPRFSPGYSRWSLTDQRVIFDLVDAERIGVRLNAQFMMMPRKSVSFCAGMGRGVVEKSRGDPCRLCSMEGCQYRGWHGPGAGS